MKTIYKKIGLLCLMALPLLMFGQNQINCTSDVENAPYLTSSSNPASVNCSFNDVNAYETVNDAYMPNANSIVYTVRLNLHIMQEDDGSGNFQNNAADRAFLQQLVTGVNDMYANIQQPVCHNVATENFIVDSRIRFSD
jgi:hypothetical protein